MEASARRCFLEVYTDGGNEPRLLQLEPTVKFYNVLKRLGEGGDLYWGDHCIDPQTTPAALGMACGVDEANTLWFIPAPPRAKPYSVFRDDPTVSVDSPPLADATECLGHRPGCGTSLPAVLEGSAAPRYSSGHGAEHGTLLGARMASSTVPTPSWYTRPRLLSPAPPLFPPSVVTPLNSAAQMSPTRRPRLAQPPALRAMRSPHSQVQPPSRMPRHPVADAASGTVDVLEGRGSEGTAPMRYLYVARAPRTPPLRHSAVPVRRNAPVFIDPNTLVDATYDAVEALQRELRHLRGEMRAMRLRHGYDASLLTPVRQGEGRLPSMEAPSALPSPICLSTMERSVEELATELHDKQMRRLREQRRFLLAPHPGV
ncbi:hypothetical protein Q4I30_006639 [Leishmania utingensis]|uniref:Uncharacterized protein n=1 Tax=Leishmania utingensis TaxID=653362 RepID=A0AAW3A0E2_9TRYP